MPKACSVRSNCTAGSLITIDHEGVAALAAKTRHVEIPVTAIVDVVLTGPTIMANGRLELVVRTTDGDSRYDPKAPNPFSVSFLAKDLDGFRNVAQSIEAAKPAEPAAIEPPKPEKRRPFWRRGAFWSMAALAVVFCCLMNSCGSVSDDSATESMPDVVGLDYAHVHQALADYHDVDYIDLKGNPTLSGVATKQSPKAGAKVSHSTGITVILDPQGKTKEQKEQKLSKRVADCKDKDAATVIAGLDADKLTGTIKTSSNDPADMADTIRGSIVQGTAYIVTDAIVDNGKIDLVVDTVAHHNRELASQQIPAMCEAAGKQAHPYGFKVPLFSDNSGVVFSDDTNWSYSFEANITNAFEAVAKGADHLYRYPDRPEHRGEQAASTSAGHPNTPRPVFQDVDGAFLYAAVRMSRQSGRVRRRRGDVGA